jgi:uncharacterized protein YjbJ (UPF0337 family)
VAQELRHPGAGDGAAAPFQEEERTLMAGKTEKAKGRIEKAAGDLTDDPNLRRRGQNDEAAGKVKDAVDRGIDKARGKK